jgi:hypothetical protein
MTRFLSINKLVKSEENLLTVKKNCSQKSNLLKKIAHSRNLLTEFARSIEKLLTMKNLAGSDGSTRWLNVSHQANQRTAGAHHATVSVVTAGTSWKVRQYIASWKLRKETRRPEEKSIPYFVWLVA